MRIFQGFTGPRHHQHNLLIRKLVREFNANKCVFVSSSLAQAAKIPDLSESLIRSWLIEISGGNDSISLQAWNVDPAKVNIPTDWSVYKQSAGLKFALKRNEGTLEQNLRAAVIWLTRKGLGDSGQPPTSRQRAIFDGWEVAIRRYNTRKGATKAEKNLSVNHAQQIINRIGSPTKYFPVTYSKSI